MEKFRGKIPWKISEEKFQGKIEKFGEKLSYAVVSFTRLCHIMSYRYNTTKIDTLVLDDILSPTFSDQTQS